MFAAASRRLSPSLMSCSRRGLATAAATRPRTAIVTGAARGIGKAIALRLARDGYDICVNDLPVLQAEAESVAREIGSMDGRRACVALGDVSDASQVGDVVATSVRSLGPLDTMVANAGVARVKALLEYEAGEFEHIFRVNVGGVHNCFAAASRQLIAQGECTPQRPGKLLAASSVAGFRAMGLMGPYGATKFAVRGLVQAYALEMGPHHITANAYGPGIIGTDMWELIDRELGKVAGGEVKAGEMMQKTAEGAIALGRTGVADDVTGLVSFLAGKDSNYITGQTQIVDGGLFLT
ncbi:hypothetical protein MCOR27_003598 [Pyricularia oryzae]|uniref:Uncharacterized protein n=2 Tax=Pyricularia TaxID=48558 RepID=A0ABQ8N6E2_PYRGI|nr:hypothetical protein MCOR01_000282 [Pyricularia oryzae]KAI6291538.1 hypothetical protein MCOR33_010544 [Pyricularia grisea]KAI6254486.1 hypothetical protein MCOR19_009011 [Pyricularia oryzae]KAI6266586.1 hypothetical protein MCOR26_010106 [Pyricularia oryzae]KAI6282834.1 hypothetical protein MCOR27_003598 [Pyricularia oryzae]